MSDKIDTRQLDILLIRLDAIGDAILWFDSARHFRDIYPGRHITLLANVIWAPLAKELDYFDDVITVDTSVYSGRQKYFRHLLLDFFWYRKWRASIVIHPTLSRTFFADCIARWISSPIKIAAQGNNANYRQRLNRIPGFGYSDSLKWYSEIIEITPTRMELTSNAAFVSRLAKRPIQPEIPNLKSLIFDNGLGLPSVYIVVVPGAGNRSRCWPIEHFEAVCSILPGTISIVVCGTASEQPLTAHLMKRVTIPDRVIDLTGKTTLKEMLSVIASAALVIANESSAIHIAAGLQIPSIVITGGGHFGRFLPYEPTNSYAPHVIHYPMDCFGCNWNCIFPHSQNSTWPCISNVSVKRVIHQVNDILARMPHK